MWESATITLNCGCLGNLPWTDDIVGTSAQCSKHGRVEVEKASRIYEAKPSKDFQLSVGRETESPDRGEGVVEDDE